MSFVKTATITGLFAGGLCALRTLRFHHRDGKMFAEAERISRTLELSLAFKKREESHLSCFQVSIVYPREAKDAGGVTAFFDSSTSRVVSVESEVSLTRVKPVHDYLIYCMGRARSIAQIEACINSIPSSWVSDR